ncbi:hypothetical protein FRC01_008212 [Tulasnella sp. 417]|nr:hypothetical protein FRC01_008212 [Tulasnella sp. 417]
MGLPTSSWSPSQRPPPPALPTRPSHQHPLPPPTSSENGSVSSHRTPSPAGGPLITQQRAVGSTTSSLGNKHGFRRLLKESKRPSSGSHGGGAQTDFECDDVGVMQQQASSSGRTQANHRFTSMKSTPPPLPLPTDSPPSASRGGWQTDVEGKGSKSGKVEPRLRIESKLQAFTAGLRRHHNMLSDPPQSQTQSPLSPSRPAPPPKPVDLRSPTSRQNLRPPVLPQGVVDDRDEGDKDATNPPTTPGSYDSHMSGRSDGRPHRTLTPTMIAAQNVAAASALMPNKVTQLAARVASAASSESRNSLLLIPGARGGSPDSGGSLHGQPRNSFQMPNSPSFSAALSYMQSMENDEDKDAAAAGSGEKRDKRRSAAPAPASFLRSVPEGSAAHLASNGSSGPAAASSSGGVVAGPPRGENSGPRTHLATPMTPQTRRGMKRRSASLGDVFKGGSFTPSMALAARGLVNEHGARREAR